MTHTKSALPALALMTAALLVGSAWGEDIDLYVSGDRSQNAPNVLLFLDNSANWSDQAQNWSMCAVRNTSCPVLAATNARDPVCVGYVKTIWGNDPANCDKNNFKDPTLAQGQVELRALKLVLNELVCNPPSGSGPSVNFGLMLFKGDKGNALDPSAGSGAYIRRAVLPLSNTAVSPATASTCANLVGDANHLGDFDLIDSKIQGTDFKASQDAQYGDTYVDIFKYFGGYTNPLHATNDSPNTPKDGAGTPPDSTHFGPVRYASKPVQLCNGLVCEDPQAFTDAPTDSIYQSPIDANSSCGNNYVVFVGNNGAQKPKSDTTAKTMLQNMYKMDGKAPTALGPPNSLINTALWADEWANFLDQTDVSSAPNQQTVLTYTLDISFANPDADRSALFQSMALHGGTGVGGYFKVNGNLKNLIDAFTQILTTITAKNSVFASSSLPVSVNTQGTYLNQVFIGMFRPDGNARQRWAGNLKQYKFAVDPISKSLFLADATGAAAVDNANTGFIQQCAVSFWTSDSGSYWQNDPDTKTLTSGCQTPPFPNTTAKPTSDWPDGNIVEKGAVGELLRQRACGASTTTTYCGRNIKTCATSDCASIVDFTTANVTLPVSPPAVPACTYGSGDLLNWAAGGNLGDGPPSVGTDAKGNTTCTYEKYSVVDNTLALKVRPTAHGDVVHSRPLAINYGGVTTTTDANGKTTTTTTNDVIVFYGAGDGMLHAIDGNQTGASAGHELWAFVAPEFFPKLQRLRDDTPLISYPTVDLNQSPTPKPRDYFFDGAIGAYQERGADGGITKTYIFPSMRRGGRMIYAFDAKNRPDTSDPTHPSDPTYMWKFGCPHATDDSGCTSKGANVTSIGQTWSTPRVIRLSGDSTLYLVFGGGYDPCEDSDVPTCTASSKGAGIFVLDAETGDQVAYIDLTAVKDSGSKPITAGRIVADVAPVDVNFDGFVDVLYAADTRGNVWRINTSDLANAGKGMLPSNWTTHRLAYVSDWSDPAQSRKFLYAPDVVTIGSTNSVLLGSGDREHPLSNSSAAKVINRFYGLRDAYGSTPSDIKGTDCDKSGDTALDSNCDLLNVTDTTKDYSTAVLGAKGWVFDLETAPSTFGTKEQVVTTPATVGGVTYFSTYQATDKTKTYQCGNLGTGRGYAVNFLTGGLAPDSTKRDQAFTGGGLPPSPVTGIVDVDGKGTLEPFILGGKPPDSDTGSSLEGHKPKISVSSVRKKVYRYPKIDAK